MEKNSEKFIKIKNHTEVPGQTSDDQKYFYQEIVNWFDKDIRVLEVGSAWGKSTWAWLDVLKEGSTLEVVDMWNYSEQRLINKDKKFAKKIIKIFSEYNHKTVFLHNIKQHKNFKQLTKIHSINHKKFMTENTEKFDIIFLDGDHSFENVFNELLYYRGSSVICGDDYNLNHQDVINAVSEFYKKFENEYELIIYGKFFILKKRLLSD